MRLQNGANAENVRYSIPGLHKQLRTLIRRVVGISMMMYFSGFFSEEKKLRRLVSVPGKYQRRDALKLQTIFFFFFLSHVSCAGKISHPTICSVPW